MEKDRAIIKGRLIRQYVTKSIEKTIIFKRERWAALVMVLLTFIIRMLLTEGYYAIAYILGFNYL